MLVTMEQANERVRSHLLAQVEHRRSQGLPRMAAYDAVASSLGKSASWVRKIIGRSPNVTASVTDWFNLETLCARIDAHSARVEARAASIRGDDEIPQTAPVNLTPREGVLEPSDSSAEAVTR